MKPVHCRISAIPLLGSKSLATTMGSTVWISRDTRSSLELRCAARAVFPLSGKVCFALQCFTRRILWLFREVGRVEFCGSLQVSYQ